jgi:hypothetical protein
MARDGNDSKREEQGRPRRGGIKMKAPFGMSQEQFIAELLRRYPELRVETLPNGEQVIYGIRLKTPEERAAAKKGGK